MGEHFMGKNKTAAPYVEFGNRLREFREKEYNTQTAFAEAINIEVGSYRMYELGYRRPDYEILLKIADVLDVTTDELLGRGSRESKIERIVDEVHESLDDKHEVTKHKLRPKYEDFYYLWDEAEELRDKYLRRRIREAWEDKCRKIDLENEHKLHMPMLRGIAGAIGIQFDIFEKYCYKTLYYTDVTTPFELLLFIYFSGFDPYADVTRDLCDYIRKDEEKPKIGWNDEIDEYLAVSAVADYFRALKGKTLTEYYQERGIDTEVSYSEFPKEFFSRYMEYERPKEKRVDWVEEAAAAFLRKDYTELLKKEKADKTQTVFMALKKRFFLEFEVDYTIAEDMKNPLQLYGMDELDILEEVLPSKSKGKKGRKGNERSR